MDRLHACLLLSVLTGGCSSIWNAGDLHGWVHKQALKSGCEPDSIVLDDWYTPIDGHNVWQGTCIDKRRGKQVQLQIGVDEVWTPSG